MNFYLVSLVKTAIVAAALLTSLAYLQWIERKVLAHIQLRMGPYRVGPHGLLQPLADVIKLLTKEDLIPAHVNKGLYLLAPFLGVAVALTAISVIPFGPKVEIFGIETYLQLTDLNIGVLFLLALSGLGVYAIALAGWSSNNKYSLLGGLRSSAQMISYELPLAFAIASPLLLLNTLSLRTIAESQGGFLFGFVPRWSIFQGPFPQLLAFAVFLVAAFAETNRLPFDLPEAENELVAGFHTEYSSMKFALFFMSEYCNMITMCALATHLFLGGWHPPLPDAFGVKYFPAAVFLFAAAVLFFHASQTTRGRKWDRYTYPVFGLAALALAIIFLLPPLQPILHPIFWFVAKTGVLLFLFIWVRGTLPRFRYDQLMRFAWGRLFPVSLVNLFATALLVALFK